MSYNPDSHHRRSIRLRSYDYSWSGTYFVTIVVRGRQCLFGEADGETISLNNAGEMIERNWLDLPDHFSFCELDDWVVMPNHFHGILIFNNPVSQQVTVASHIGGTSDNSLSRVMQAFKSLTTTNDIKGVHEKNWPPFDKKLWLRNYWERVLRDDREWKLAYNYIFNNPAQWQNDKHHPDQKQLLRSQSNPASPTKL